MAYTEEELLARLAADLARPDTLWRQAYIVEDGVTADTGKRYSDIVAEYLFAHRGALAKTDSWGVYRTTVSTASAKPSRLTSALLGEGRLYGSFLLDGALSVAAEAGSDVALFDLMALSRGAGELSLFALTPAGTMEAPLSRVLRLWAAKESIDDGALKEALGLAKLPRVTAVSLVTGAGHERFGDAPREDSVAVKKLAALLGVRELSLFHGFHAVPLTRGLPAPGQLTEAELTVMLEKDAAKPETLYQKEYVNRQGLTADTGRPCAAVIAEWLLANRGMWVRMPGGFYRLAEGMRTDSASGNETFISIRKQKVLPPFGRVLPESLVYLGSRGRQMGRPALLLHAGDGTWSLLRAVEMVDASDTLLRAVLRAFTHLALINGKRLAADLRLPEGTTLEARLLVREGTPQYDHFLRDLPDLTALMKAMGVGLMTVADGYEAVY